MRALAPSLVVLLQGCNSGKVDDYTRLYHTEPIAPGMSEDEVRELDHLGPTIVERGVNFSVFAGRAERVDLLLFDDADASEPIQRWEMSSFDGVWNLYVEGVGPGTMYGYVAWGSNWPYADDWYCGSQRGFVADVDSYGNRFNPNKLLFDPWGKSLTRDHDWGVASAGTGESRRAQCTWGASSKSVVMESAYAWSDADAAWRQSRQDGTSHGWNEVILYEAHPKGLTANGRDGVDHPGTYRGLGEMASYFADLGVTAVELLPVHEKPADGGYWGYNSISFFAPELTYSADYEAGGPPEAVVDEFKWMVDQLHAAGIEVILDVVYNHTGEGGLWRDKIYTDDSPSDADAVYDAYNLDTVEAATIFNFRGLDNWAYYALSEDNQTYWNNTGVGNETRPNYAPMRQLILDSLHWQVEELHVDGFRFDLAGILGEADGDYNNWDDPANTVLQDIVDDPILQAYDTRIIAEPWTAGGSYTSIGNFPASTDDPAVGWGEWNASFRDWWRQIVNEDTWALNSAENGIDGGGVITGSYARYAWNGRKPYHTTNFVTAHDGFTMYDLLSFSEKQNLCGVLNPTCCDDPYSVWCDTDSGESNNRSRDWGTDLEGFKRQLMRDFFVGMMISHGTPMLLGGDEWMRTQYGNNNAYSTTADNEWNWFRWGEWQAQDERWRMMAFVSKMTRFRLAHAYALSPTEWGEHMPLAWKDATNSGDANWGGRHLMMHYYDDGSWEEPELAILINMERYDVTFTLPEGRTWGRVVDTQEYFDGDAYLSENGLDTRATANYWDTPTVIEDGVYTVPGSTIVILEEQ
jgi:glycogen operon protein